MSMIFNTQHRKIIESIDRSTKQILNISHAIHGHPELGHEETFAAGLLIDILEKNGFKVNPRVAGLPTAFLACKGKKGGPRVAFLAEYDALPEIGHACGHNLIAASALAAGIGLGAVVGALPGEVLVIGTPAEETNGGKIMMVREGVFTDIDAALMIHPFNGNFTHTESLALNAIELSFHGIPSHAAIAPWEGKNALDAILLTFNNINALRQQIRSSARIHGVITKGGSALGIIPHNTQARFYVRDKDRAYLDSLSTQLLACAHAGAMATGAQLEVAYFENSFDNMINNTVLAERVRDYLQGLGAEKFFHASDAFGSIDMGNVSHIVPAVHLLIDITGNPEIGLHTLEFANAAATSLADEALLRSGKGLALAGYDLISDPDFLASVRSDFAGVISTNHLPLDRKACQ